MSSEPAFLLRAVVLAVLLATPAQAQLPFPEGAVVTRKAAPGLTTYQLAVRAHGTSAGMTVPVEGEVLTRAARIDGEAMNTLALVRFYRRQLEDAGFRILLDCDQATCGGFDFRFALDTLPPPAMEVSLSDYRFLSARNSTDGSAAAILVSRTPAAAFIQISEIGAEVLPPLPAAPAEPLVADATDSLGDLLTAGSVPLDGLLFEPGSAELAGDPGQVLAELARWLSDHPDRSVILVGHTDNQGSLESNMSVSRRRAESVRLSLIEDYQADPARLSVDGIGFLAPRASNETEEGRALNRRVEAVLR
jgi:outer membrane protein OmpA-like peptidoglycan-associated protein